MSVDTYFQRYAFPKTWIKSTPPPNLGMVITIPAYDEISVIPTLESLGSCTLPSCNVEVILVINGPDNVSTKTRDVNQTTYRDARDWSKINSTESLYFHIILADNLPAKDHGVGLARKIGMDEALRRLHLSGNIENGIITCFDADSRCKPNYLIEVYEHFIQNRKCPGASIYYEHPLEGLSDMKLLSGIIQYELFLRYYIHAQQFTGFPNAYHTVGSSIAVRAGAYYKQGGMNKRKAGEDFYFLHKIIGLGSFMNIKSTTVYPSARVSSRVPFGTGRALSDWMSGTETNYMTYDPQSFVEIKKMFASLKLIYEGEKWNEEFSPPLISFLENVSFQKQINKIKTETTDFSSFRKRFFSWFNGFRMMKYLHYSRDHFYANIPVTEAAKWLLVHYHGVRDTPNTPEELLKIYRNLDQDM